MAVLASQLTGLMDMKIFYKGKTMGKAASLASALACWSPGRGWVWVISAQAGAGSLRLYCCDNMPII